MNNGWTIALMLFIMLPIVTITTIIPYLTRKIESFGVTIPENAQQDPQIVAWKKQYLWRNSLLSVIIIGSLLFMTTIVTSEVAWSMWFGAHLIVYMIVSFLIYLRQHKRVKSYKQTQNWSTSSTQRVVIDTAFRQRKITISYYWFIPHIIVTVVTALIGILNYEQFPAVIPMKYNFSGEIINSAVKSYSTVLWPVVTQSLLLFLFIFVHFTINRTKQLVEASDPEKSLMRSIIFRRRWSILMMISSFLFVLLFLFIELSLLYSWNGIEQIIVPLIVTAVMLIGAITLSITTGQGGSRIKLDGNVQATTVTSADHDQHWKWGVFYYNREDPALFVEKRFGVGMTMNFARPLGWIILLAILIIPLGLSFLIK